MCTEIDKSNAIFASKWIINIFNAVVYLYIKTEHLYHCDYIFRSIFPSLLMLEKYRIKIKRDAMKNEPIIC